MVNPRRLLFAIAAFVLPSSVVDARSYDFDGKISRVLHAPVGRRSWYYANRKSEAVPQGLNQEETIKAIWSED